MAVISMKALLESGVHFGHRTNKWDPRMKPFIFTERNGIHIIDLQQTVKSINNAYGIIRDCVANGGTVLFVGTKRQAQETVREEAMRAGMPYVTERWLGGMLTNWNTMRARIVEMERLEQLRDSGEINRLTKKEGLLIEREITRLNTRLDGVRAMKGLPDLVFIVDVGREDAAVHECNILNIPIVALVDTNCNPEGVDYVIPSNDDAIRAIKLLVGKMADAVLEGRAMRKDIEPEIEMPQAAEPGAPSAAPAKRQAHPAVEMEEELGDDALLGKSTLAKLTPKAEVIAEPVEPVEEFEAEEEPVPAALAEVVAEPAGADVFEEPVEEPGQEIVDELEQAPVEEPIEEVAAQPAAAVVEPEIVNAEEPAAEPIKEPAAEALVKEEPAPARKRTGAAVKHEEPKKAAKKPAASKPEAKKPARKPAATKTASKSKTKK
jgi:small subunit ribosomal protein S2